MPHRWSDGCCNRHDPEGDAVESLVVAELVCMAMNERFHVRHRREIFRSAALVGITQEAPQVAESDVGRPFIGRAGNFGKEGGNNE